MRPLVKSERMSPNRLVVTMTSNWFGFLTSCMAQLSTISSLNSIPACRAATLRPVSRKSPLVHLRMFALCTRVTFRRPRDLAYWKAYSTIRSLPLRVMMLIDSAALCSSSTKCSTPE